VDNPPGIIRNLLNLAIVSDAAGNTSRAREYLDAIDRYTNNLAGSSPSDLREKETHIILAETAAFRARFALDDGRPDLAAGELGQISDIPRSVAGRFSNLHARLAEHQGDFPSMLRHASSGISANRRAKDETELADSHRLAARAYLATGRHADAEKHFLDALELDRKLARPNCVKADLEGLAGAASIAGDPGKADLFRQRARATQVSRHITPAP
jgi:tetratricopeptide (TPR) repeat protein